MTTRKERAAGRRRQRKINTILFFAIGLVVIVAAVFLLFSKSSTQSVSPAQVGQRLGDFSLTDIHGQTVRLSDYAGKVVLLNAWATWCPPCRAEIPDLNAYYLAHKDDGFVLLGIDAGELAGTVAAFVHQENLAYPMLVDPNISLLSSLGVHGFPTSILVGSDGMVKAIYVGGFTPQALEDEITPYLQK